MSLHRKLLNSFLLVLIMLVFIAIYAIVQLNKINDEYTYLIDDRTYKVVEISKIENATSLQGMYIRSYLLNQRETDLTVFREQQTYAKNALDAIEPMFKTEQMRKEIATYKENVSRYNEAIEKIIRETDNNNVAYATQLLYDEALPASTIMRSSLSTIVDFQTVQMEKTTAEANATTLKTKRIITIIAVIGTIISIALAFYIPSSIANPIRKLQISAEKIANGELNIEDVHVHTRDEVQNLAQSFNNMKQQLASLVQKISISAQSTASATEQLVASTDEITTATKEIASKMEEITLSSTQAAQSSAHAAQATSASSMRVNQIADATQALYDRSSQMQNSAEVGYSTLETTEQQMTLIQQSSNETSRKIKQLSIQSNEIENFTKVITEITEQTNLLSLNAAIEAARAGEHGKGFAVVADEVRKLAEQSKQSAAQITVLTGLIQKDTKDVEESIQITTKNIDQGALLVKQAQNAFTTIRDDISTMTGEIQEISAATEDISTNANEVTKLTDQMANTVQASAKQSDFVLGVVEEQTASMNEIHQVVQSLNTDAISLQEEVNNFKI
jgi:methyl-accepting chemotaxis protein